MLAQLLEGLVVVLLTQVRELMHDDHAQQESRQGLEERGHLDYVLALELAS